MTTLNTPRATGRGGGVATLFKDRFKCSLLSVEKYTSFELQLLKLELSITVFFCALIYRPPKYDKAFIQDFSDFLLLCRPLIIS